MNQTEDISWNPNELPQRNPNIPTTERDRMIQAFMSVNAPTPQNIELQIYQNSVNLEDYIQQCNKQLQAYSNNPNDYQQNHVQIARNYGSTNFAPPLEMGKYIATPLFSFY